MLGRVGKKREENSVSTFGRFRLCTSFESSPVSVKDVTIIIILIFSETESDYFFCVSVFSRLLFKPLYFQDSFSRLSIFNIVFLG